MYRTFNTITSIHFKAPLTYWGFFGNPLTGSSSTIGWVPTFSSTLSQDFNLWSADNITFHPQHVLDEFIDMYWGFPTDIGGDDIDNYYDYYIRGKGISKEIFKRTLLKNTDWYGWLILISSLISEFYMMFSICRDVFTREPISGYSGEADTSYEPEFNYGYQWKYCNCEISFDRNLSDVDIDKITYDMLIENMMGRDGLGVTKNFTSFYPLKAKMEKVNIGDSLIYDLRFVLNGYYWLMKQEIIDHRTYYTWEPRSYGYSDVILKLVLTKTSTSWNMKTYKDGIEVNLEQEIEKLYSYNGYARNVGTSWDASYTPNDIPVRFNIWPGGN